MPDTTALDLAVLHQPRPPYAYPVRGERLRVRLRLALGDTRLPSVHYGERMSWHESDREAGMRWLADDARFRYFEAELAGLDGGVRYSFRLEPEPDSHDQMPVWVSQRGVTSRRPEGPYPEAFFHWPYFHRDQEPTTPDWVRDAVCYEIFPDRFARGTPPVAPEIAGGWSGTPARGADVFWGGDLRGIIEHVDHIAGLGANLVWLTPIFASSSNHKYDTADYGSIDPHFGDDELFANLVATYRRHGIRILLDGVFNHVGVNFAPWLDVRERGMESPYWGWFDVRGERPTARPLSYRAFANTPHMPRLMTGNPEVQAYLIDHAQGWMRMGISGWRLDVADEVDLSFLRAFRREMKAIDRDAYLVGEMWHEASRWLEGDMVDGVMNYPLRRALLQFLAGPTDAPGAPTLDDRLDAPGFLAVLGQIRMWAPGWATTAALNPVSTHDAPRFLTALGADMRRWRLGLTFLMTYEGIPQLYYGDEIGLEGGFDPDCRRPMRWDPAEQNADMLGETRRLIRVRRDLPALRASGFRPLASSSPHIAAYLRGPSSLEAAVPESCPPDAVALVALNRSETAATVDLPLGPNGVRDTPAWPAAMDGLDVLSGAIHVIEDCELRLTLPPYGAAVLVPAHDPGAVNAQTSA